MVLLLPAPSEPLPKARLLEEFVSLVRRHTSFDGENLLAIPSLKFYRYAAPSKSECQFTKVSLIFSVQGSKTVTVGDSSHTYDAEHCLLTLLDMPASGHVESASPERPTFCVAFEVDMKLVADLVGLRELPPPDETPVGLEISVGRLPLEVLDAVYRLARLLDTPKHIAMLAPMLEREIIYRLLMSQQGMRLRHALLTENRLSKVSKAIEWIKARYDTAFRIDELAAHVNMSTSSLHQHFKDATTLSPLQFQKRLRLVAARQQLIKRGSDVRVVASAVGYDNLSQFHREYKRLFGAPPIQDASRQRSNFSSNMQAS